MSEDENEEPDSSEHFSSPLPPDDRLWRHPSELGTTGGADSGKRRGISSRSFAGAALKVRAQRAGALSAGLAGAFVAAGLVLVGTHLATALGAPTRDVAAPSPDVTAASIGGEPAGGGAARDTLDTISGSLASMASRVGDAMVRIEARDGSVVTHGEGLVIRSSCLVLTSGRLVEGAGSLALTFANGTEAPAEVVGIDPQTGIAVVKCPDTGLPAMEWGGTDNVSTNEMVALVLSGPPDIDLSFGLVRADEQQVATPPSNATNLLDEIETDIPAVDDGTALLDGAGAVVGVVVGSFDGNSLATPTWLALAAATQILHSGHVVPGWLGIRGTTGPAGRGNVGVRVVSVVPASAASKAGIEPGDVIESVDGHTVTSMPNLQANLHCLAPGTPISLSVLRGHKTWSARAVLAVEPEHATPG